MPTALLKPCASPGCPELVVTTWCPAHTPRRASAHQRGYTRRWRSFKNWWIAELVGRYDTAATCGARWPEGPVTQDSQCRAQGKVTGGLMRQLHLDHEPPLTEAERQNELIVCDPYRVQLLCQDCHDAKTKRGR